MILKLDTIATFPEAIQRFALKLLQVFIILFLIFLLKLLQFFLKIDQKFVSKLIEFFC